MLKILQWQSLDERARADALARPASSTSEELCRGVAAIVARVRAEGDEALMDFARKFDPQVDADVLAALDRRVLPRSGRVP